MPDSLEFPLAVDLPENWVDTNAITPNGIEAGLTPKHGYNYLMSKVNEALKAVNFLEDAIENFNPSTDVSDASETSAGIIRIATQEEAVAGSANNLAITPASLKMLLAAIATLSAVPKGLISMWSGTKATIPVGWLLCDGTNGTPDLRNKFIRGIGTGEADEAGTKGGADTVTLATTNLPSHAHTTTAESTGLNLSATASIDAATNDSTGLAGKFVPTFENSTYLTSVKLAEQSATSANVNRFLCTPVGASFGMRLVGSGGTHTHTGTVSISGNGTTATTGSGQAISILPTYYTLAYIIKI